MTGTLVRPPYRVLLPSDWSMPRRTYHEPDMTGGEEGEEEEDEVSEDWRLHVPERYKDSCCVTSVIVETWLLSLRVQTDQKRVRK